jgi:flagellar FliJ protein
VKRFNFRLQKLLQLKQHRKLEKQKALARAERLRRMEEAHLEGLRAKMSHELENLAAAPAGSVDVARRIHSVYYQHRLNASMVTQQQAVAQAKKREGEKRGELLDADKEEKVFSKLKQRQRERYLLEIDRRYQKETDEIATNVFLRRKEPSA